MKQKKLASRTHRQVYKPGYFDETGFVPYPEQFLNKKEVLKFLAEIDTPNDKGYIVTVVKYESYLLTT